MNRAHASIAFGIGVAAVGLLAWRQAQASAPATSISTGLDAVLLALPDTLAQPLESLSMDWQQALNTRGAAYKQAFAAAEEKYSLPPDLIARMAWQESHYRPDIINGGPNSAGAVGILQIIPRFHPEVNPRDPFASIDYAGRFMRQLYGQFGTWAFSLMAYNWGPGNVQNWLTMGGNVPEETENYWSAILADINQANGTDYV